MIRNVRATKNLYSELFVTQFSEYFTFLLDKNVYPRDKFDYELSSSLNSHYRLGIRQLFY